MKKPQESPVLTHVRHLWDHAARQSYTALNSALYSCLKHAIVTGFKFQPDDVQKLSSQFGFHRWNGGGEGLYALACGSERGTGNTSAAIAFEQWFGRPAILWAEKTAKAERLFVGAQFTWRGERVTVTSIAGDHLIACSYHPGGHSSQKEPGDYDYFDGHIRRIEILNRKPDGTLAAVFSAPTNGQGESRAGDILHRHRIPFTTLAAVRKDYDRRRKGYEAQIAAATTLERLNEISATASGEGQHAWRHFDLDLLRAALKARFAAIRQEFPDEARKFDEQALARQQAERADRLKRWLAGEDVRDFFGHDQNHLRIKDGFVEVSNGNRVTLAAARATLAFVQRHRRQGWHQNGSTHAVDAFQLSRVDAKGVTIGCTFLEWAEVDRLAPLLKQAAKA